MHFLATLQGLCLGLSLSSHLVSAQTFNQPLLYPVPASSLSPSYLRLVANRSASFHPNFNTGETGALANGALVSPSIEDDANGVTFLGSALFVRSLQGGGRTQFLDQLIIQEGNAFGILFAQRTQVGSTRIQIESGEVMVFDENALLNKLITVSQGALASLQAVNQALVPEFQPINITRIDDDIPPSFTSRIKGVTAQLNRNFNSGNSSSNSAFVSQNIIVHADGNTTTGVNAFLNLFTRYDNSIAGLVAHDEYIFAQGNYVAVEFVRSGIRNGTFTTLNGTHVAPDGGLPFVRGMRFLRFDRQSGLIQEIWEVANNDDFLISSTSALGDATNSQSSGAGTSPNGTNTARAANATQTGAASPMKANVLSILLMAIIGSWFMC
ncbi:hypothetical protein F5884DRAFT_798842 [Xylogone sp. PMI_703]|nr:hypothetical protein F5884DRAFT_798842 [Xylogone sp. PMI_703]